MGHETSSELSRSRLAKLCALFSSDKDGEVLNAARLAQELVKKSGLSWSDIFGVGLKEPSPLEVDADLWAKVAFCQKHPEHLIGSEPDFLQTVKKWLASGGEPSAKQIAWLEKILRRIEVLEADDA